MAGCDRVGMDKSIALRHPFRSAWSSGRGLYLSGFAWLALLSLYLPWSLPTDKAAESPAINQFVHWQDADHDWLLVVDPETRELVVYDAVDGRPLDRLGADDGLPQVQSIALHGPRLTVTGPRPAAARLLRLPTLQAVAVNTD